jgi:hypothetical protein
MGTDPTRDYRGHPGPRKRRRKPDRNNDDDNFVFPPAKPAALDAQGRGRLLLACLGSITGFARVSFRRFASPWFDRRVGRGLDGLHCLLGFFHRGSILALGREGNAVRIGTF